MPVPSLETAIPHRPPMLLLDEVVSCDETTIVCRKTFRADEFFLQGHYPDYPLVPGVILCECAMQAGGVLLSTRVGADCGIPVATRLDQVRFRHMVRPGETVEIEVRLRDQVAQAFYLEGRVRRDLTVVARLEFACALVPHPAGEGS